MVIFLFFCKIIEKPLNHGGKLAIIAKIKWIVAQICKIIEI